MNTPSNPAFIAFDGDRRIAAGDLREVARAAKQALDRHSDSSVLVFDGVTSDAVDLDFRGSVDDVLARLPIGRQNPGRGDRRRQPTRGPGRPKLGVVAREVTLLPRHWEWLARQSGGASVAIRKLVDDARRGGEDKDRIREGAGSGLSFHVGDGRQQAAFRRGDPRAVRTRSFAFPRVDRRMARRRARPCRTAGGTGVSADRRQRQSG